MLRAGRYERSRLKVAVTSYRKIESVQDRNLKEGDGMTRQEEKSSKLKVAMVSCRRIDRMRGRSVSSRVEIERR